MTLIGAFVFGGVTSVLPFADNAEHTESTPRPSNKAFLSGLFALRMAWMRRILLDHASIPARRQFNNASTAVKTVLSSMAILLEM